MPASVFISYRRGAADGTAGRIYDAACTHFGNDHVFRDIDSIQPGDDFVDVLTNTLAGCRALVVIIGPEWSTVTDSAGRRRLDDPYDFVRLEVETAVRNGTPIFPVLIDGAPMLRTEDLPPSMATLARRQAAEISHTRFKYDTGMLLTAIERVLQAPASGSAREAPPSPAVDSVPAEDAVAQAGLSLRNRVVQVIPAGVPAVWAVITKVQNHVVLWPTVLEVHPVTPQPFGPGFAWREEHQSGSVTNRVIATVIEYEPRRRFALRVEYQNGRFSIEVATLSPADGGTSLEYCRYGPRPFLGPSADSATREYVEKVSRMAKSLESYGG